MDGPGEQAAAADALLRWHAVPGLPPQVWCDPGVRRALVEATERAGGGGAPPRPGGWPQLVVPPCTNTPSLYVWLLVDGAVQMGVHVTVRRVLGGVLLRRPLGPADETLVFTATLLTTFAVVGAAFRLLHRWVSPQLEEPHLLLRLMVVLWLYAMTHRILVVVPRDSGWPELRVTPAPAPGLGGVVGPAAADDPHDEDDDGQRGDEGEG